MWGRFEFVPVTYTSVVHSTRPSQNPGWSSRHMHQHSRRRRRRRHSTCWYMMWCEGVGWLHGWFALMKFCEIRERNVTIRSEIWTMTTCSLGFWNIREYVTLWRLILRSLGCIVKEHLYRRIVLTTLPKTYNIPQSSPACFKVYNHTWTLKLKWIAPPMHVTYPYSMTNWG